MTVGWGAGEGVRADVITYNTLISAAGRAGKWPRAVQLLEHMRSAGLRADAVTYNALITAARRAGEPDEAFAAFECMRAAKVLCVCACACVCVCCVPVLHATVLHAVLRWRAGKLDLR